MSALKQKAARLLRSCSRARALLVETPASATMGKRSRKVAATPAAVPAEADSPASCAPTARKCSRFSDPALEDEADGLAPVGTAIEQPQDDKASDLPAVTSSFQDEAPAPSFESPALQIASTKTTLQATRRQQRLRKRRGRVL